MKLSQLAAGLILGFGIASAALAQTTMKISISTSQNSHQGVAIDTFAKEVAARTNGRYKVETFYNGSLGGERVATRRSIGAVINVARSDDAAGFRPWLLEGTHRPTFCVWELGAVWHEQQAWSRFLRSARGAVAREAYLRDTFEGQV